MKSIKLLFAGIALITLVSCGFQTDDERTFESSDQEQMTRLMKLLDQRSIPYEFRDGVIRYKSSFQEEFEKTASALDSITPVQFVDTDVRAYFHNILDTEYIEYLELDRDGGTWTAWWPKSEERKMKILDQVAEYEISLKTEEDSDCEDGDEISEVPSDQLLNMDSIMR